MDTTARPSSSDIFTLLHVSDVHFGTEDQRAEMRRITDALVSAAKAQDWVPDVFVFSGDLAFSGSDHEFSLGQAWLADIIKVWPELKLFIVPGNHDVVRSRAKLLLRKAHHDAKTYTALRNRLKEDLDHLRNFLNWHTALREVFDQRIISDWSEPFGCYSVVQNGARAIRLLGFNTALLSCDNEDDQQLVQDIPTLNSLLAMHKDQDECVIAVGHHPLSWLTKWNKEEVERLLNQTYGAHIYIHGHNHTQSASSSANARGEKLATLQGGAAYQGSEWRQDFSLYKLLFDRREISSRTFSFDTSSGEWIQDNAQSRVFVAPLPQGHRDLAADGNVHPFRNGHDFKVQSHEPAGQSDREVELDARRAIDNAKIVHKRVREFLDTANFLGRPIYGLTGRVKELDRITKKVKDRRSKGDANFPWHGWRIFAGFGMCLYIRVTYHI